MRLGKYALNLLPCSQVWHDITRYL